MKEKKKINSCQTIKQKCNSTKLDSNTISKKVKDLAFEALFNNLPIAFYWLDQDGYCLGGNDLELDILNMSSIDELIGKHTSEISAPGAWNNSKMVMETNQMLVFEEEVHRSNNEKIVYLSIKSPLHDEDNNVIGLLGVSIDITERKRAEEELKIAKERAEIANQAKSDFLAVVSHELRIPLTGILGMAQLLAYDNLTAEQHAQVDDIITSGNHLHSLVTDILDFSRLEAGKFELHTEPLDLRKIVEEVVMMLAGQIKVKGLELLVNYADTTPYRIFGDARALRQILLNLLNNAIKFTDKGYILLKVESLTQSEYETTLIISVKDTGIGIPLEKQQQVFERFTQADGSRVRYHGGVGLGLTIAKALIEAMNGTIRLESSSGAGSTFFCTIPFALQINAKQLSPWEVYKASVRILIVDDSLQGEVLGRHLNSSLCELTGSQEAINVLRTAQQCNQPFEIVIVGQHLEHISAEQLARTIQQQYSIQQPLLLMVVSDKFLPTQVAAKKAGFSGYITKPNQPTELLVDLTAAWEAWQDQKLQR